MLFVGEREPKSEPFIPGYMSVSPWQAIQYGPYVYEAKVSLRELGPDEDQVWGQEDERRGHPFFKERPGVFDPRSGEAVVNVPIDPKPLSGHELMRAIREAPDFESHHEVDVGRMFEQGPGLFGPAFPDFVRWRWEVETGTELEEASPDEVEEEFEALGYWTPEVEKAVMDVLGRGS